MGHYDDAYEAEEEQARVRRITALDTALVKLLEANLILSRHLGPYPLGQLQSVIDRVTLELK